MPAKPITAWAVVCDGNIDIWTMRRWARGARKEIGDLFRDNLTDETWQDGWKRAKKEGYRIIKVHIVPVEE
jgi:tRNA(Met) C34 N-acetyltransferase TmcA